ncbi:MAG: TRAP transporter substrate-binding protein [Pseudomonadota bacterium]
MKRRDFVAGVGTGLAAASLSACAKGETDCAPGEGPSGETYKMKMVTTWPPNFPGLGTGANTFARYLSEASGGRLEVKVYAAGELVPAFEVFDAVSKGTAEIGHGGAYYWRNKLEVAQLFGAVPFGLNASEMNGWMYYGGGLELWQEAYAPFDLVPFPVGNSGGQMGGWFNKPIETVDDLKGLKMRLPGLGGEVLKAMGGTPVALPGGEIFTSLQTGVIDATEWVGPYNDIAFGLHKAAKYYYYPGWHEPGTTLEVMLNKTYYDQLPADLQAIVRIAAQAANQDMYAEFSYRNAAALEQIIANPDIELREFPEDVLIAMRETTDQLLNEMAAKDEFAAKVWDSYRTYRDSSRRFQAISEESNLRARLAKGD